MTKHHEITISHHLHHESIDKMIHQSNIYKLNNQKVMNCQLANFDEFDYAISIFYQFVQSNN